jgi:hypothetical protein
MQTYSIRKEGIKEITNKNLLRSIPIMILALAGGILIGMRNTGNAEAEVNVWPYLIPLMVITLGIGLYRGLKKQEQLLATYRINITDDMISREQSNTPTISLYFNDVVEMSKLSGGSIIIKGKKPEDLITIPQQIENYDLLEKTLHNIKPISQSGQLPFLQRYGLVLAILNMALMVVVYRVENKWIVGLAGLVFTAVMIWSYLTIQRSKDIDNKTRKGLRLSILVIAAVLIYVIFKLTGLVDVPTQG